MKSKFLIALACLCGLVFTVQAKTVNVAQSGVNWKASTLTVEAFQPSHISHRDTFSCFGETNEKLPLSKNLFDLGFDSSDKGPLTLNKVLKDSICFQQAGWYKLTIKLLDYAGNKSEKETVLTVVPSDLSLTDSTLETVASKTSGGTNVIADLTNRLTCTSPTLVADGKDQCVLEVRLRDRFANVIEPAGVSGNLTLKLPEEAVADNLDASVNAYGAFLAGLHFENNERQFTWDFPQTEETLQVGLESLVPTLEPIANTGALKVTPQPINIDLEYRENQEGEISTQTIKTVTPLFSPWVSLVAANKGSLENFVLLPLNRVLNLPLELQGQERKNLPPKLTLDWKAPDLESLWVKFLDKAGTAQDTLKSLVAVSSNPQAFNLDLELRQPEGLTSDENFYLQPIVTYPQRLGGENVLVRYPLNILQGRGLASLPPFEPLKLQAAVIGRLLGSDENTPTGESLVLSGANKINFTLWREQLNRQAISLIRGQSPRTEKVFDINKGWGGGDIAYFKGVTVRLDSDDEGNTPMQFSSGVKTLIIEDGNLHITRDLKYGSNEDSLGIIVINSKPNDPLRGHLFVHQNVQNVVGNYFLDGALVSTQKLESPVITDTIENREETSNQNKDAPLALQLVLEGAVVARNTIGGADLSPSQGPNGQNVQREIALNYDLNYVRRYEPLFDANGQRVSDAQNDFCFKPEGKACFPNPAPLVILYDPRVQKLPPPGFESSQ